MTWLQGEGILQDKVSEDRVYKEVDITVADDVSFLTNVSYGKRQSWVGNYNRARQDALKRRS